MKHEVRCAHCAYTFESRCHEDTGVALDKCPTCGLTTEDLYDEDNFCDNCGNSCDDCGADVFCEECGTPGDADQHPCSNDQPIATY
jgi:hypothetical protein